MLNRDGLEYGLVWGEELELRRLLKALENRLHGCYWLLDCQTGPWRLEPDDAEGCHLWPKWVEVPKLADTSASLWRPGTLQRYVSYFVVDEYTYIWGICGTETEVMTAAEMLTASSGQVARRLGGGPVSLSISYLDGWWEVFSPNREWLERLEECVPGARRRLVSEARRLPKWLK